MTQSRRRIFTAGSQISRGTIEAPVSRLRSSPLRGQHTLEALGYIDRDEPSTAYVPPLSPTPAPHTARDLDDMGKLDLEVADQAQQGAAAPAEPQERPMSNKEKRKESKKRKNRDGDEATTSTTTTAQPEQNEVQATATATDDQGEPVLSHKEKRLAKKRKLAAVQAGEDPETVASKPAKPATTATTNAPTTIGNTLVGNTPARSAHGVWVGNLNFATHPRELLAWFADRGLKEVTRINMPGGKRSHENNRGSVPLGPLVPAFAELKQLTDGCPAAADSPTSTFRAPPRFRSRSTSRSSTSTAASC